MPAKSEAQRKMIFAKRNKYGSKEKTPEKDKWIWDKGFENKGDLPEKIEESLFQKYMTEVYDPNYMMSDDPKVYRQGREEEMKRRQNAPSVKRTEPHSPALQMAKNYVSILKTLEGDAKTPKVEEMILKMIKMGINYQEIRRVLQGRLQREAGLDVMKQQEYLNFAKAQGAK